MRFKHFSPLKNTQYKYENEKQENNIYIHNLLERDIFDEQTEDQRQILTSEERHHQGDKKQTQSRLVRSNKVRGVSTSADIFFADDIENINPNCNEKVFHIQKVRKSCNLESLNINNSESNCSLNDISVDSGIELILFKVLLGLNLKELDYSSTRCSVQMRSINAFKILKTTHWNM